MVYVFYTTYIIVDRANHEIVRAKVGKGGIFFLLINVKHGKKLEF